MGDLISVVVAAVCLAAIYSESVPTGVLGSAGLALIGMAALVAVDDGSFANVERLEGIALAFMLGFLSIALHLTLMVLRSKTGIATPRRRTTDWQSFDEEQTRPMERA